MFCFWTWYESCLIKGSMKYFSAQEVEKENGSTNDMHKSQQRQKERKKKAAAFLSKLKNGAESGGKSLVYGE